MDRHVLFLEIDKPDKRNAGAEIVRDLIHDAPDAVSRRRDQVEAGDVFTYLYTSGTTGLPKACVLTHRNFTAMTESVVAMEGLIPDGRKKFVRAEGT